jgi:3-hydroxyacyl-CoA dehydrogenase/enoyl-CoA hydratase/3-hydroxybutyryl-CoA epimerase
VLSQASTVDFDTACKIQSRYFAQVCLTKEAKNMMRAFWYDTQAVRNGQNRPKGFGKFRPKKVGVIGAGLMGSGIAYACAQAGLNVVIKDISRSVAEKGKNYAEKKLDGLVKLNQLGSVEAKEMLTRITATRNRIYKLRHRH